MAQVTSLLVGAALYVFYILCLVGMSLLSYIFMFDVGPAIGNSYLVNITSKGINYIKFFTYILWALFVVMIVFVLNVRTYIDNDTYQLIFTIVAGLFILFFMVGNALLTDLVHNKVSSGITSENKLIEMTEAGWGYIKFFSVLVWMVIPFFFLMMGSKIWL